MTVKFDYASTLQDGGVGFEIGFSLDVHATPQSCPALQDGGVGMIVVWIYKTAKAF